MRSVVSTSTTSLEKFALKMSCLIAFKHVGAATLAPCETLSCGTAPAGSTDRGLRGSSTWRAKRCINHSFCGQNGWGPHWRAVLQTRNEERVKTFRHNSFITKRSKTFVQNTKFWGKEEAIVRICFSKVNFQSKITLDILKESLALNAVLSKNKSGCKG